MQLNNTIKNILVVEDDALISMLLEDMLQELGYNVCATAATLAQALEQSKTAQFDAAILDVSLGGESSVPVAQFLDTQNKPYLFATGYGVAPEGSAASHLPVLSKPFQLSQLESALKLLETA